MDSKRIPLKLEENEVMEMYFTSHAEAWADSGKQLNAVKRVIDKIELLAEGGSSLIYTVHFSDDKTDARWILKEFYPTLCYRKDNNELVFNVENEKQQQMKSSFRNGYERIKLFSNKERSSEYTITTLPEAYSEKNGTCYILLPYKSARTFDVENASTALTYDVLIKVTEGIKRYHSMGFYYLDIKGENILLFEQEYIQLFDGDSIVRKDEIGKNKLSLKCTPIYSAPELLAAQLNGILLPGEISEQTDFYSIGSLLFHSIFKLPFVHNVDFDYSLESWQKLVHEHESMSKYSYEYRESLALFLCNILHYRKAKRFKSADEIICKLKELKELSEQDIFLRSSAIEENIFEGREDEFKQLCSCLETDTKSNSVVLYGTGGIGKSALARHYAKLRMKKYYNREEFGYDSVLIADFEKCNGDMNVLLDSIFDKYVNKIYDGEFSFQSKCKCLKDICSRSKVLVIIDNFDVEVPRNKNEFCQMGWSIIFTSRYRLKEAFGNLIPVKELDLEVLLSLFEKYYLLSADVSEKQFTQTEKKIIKRVIEKYGCHTLITELLARISGKFLLEAEGLAELFGGNFEQKVNYTKDGSLKKQSIQEALADMFSVLKNTENESASRYLTKEEIKALFNMSVLRMPIGEEEFANLSGIKKKGILAELSEKGWIERCGNYSVNLMYTIHPVIGEAIYHEMKKELNCFDMCANLAINAKALFKEKVKKMKVHSIGVEDVRYLQFMDRLCEHNLISSSKLRAEIFFLCAEWNVMCKQYEVAKECYKKALVLFEEDGMMTSEERTNIEYKIDLMEATNSWSMSINDLKRIEARAERIYRDVCEDTEPNLGIARILRDYYITIYDTKKANVLSEIIKREREKNTKAEVDESILDMFSDGITFLNNEVYDRAADAFSQSLELIESQMKLLKKEMAKINAHYGRTLGEMGREGSIAACKNSVSIRKELAQQGDDTEKSRLWISEYNLSKAYYLAGQFYEAKNIFCDAWDDYKEYGKQNVSNESSLICMRGRIEIACENCEDGIKDLEMAINLRSQGRGKDNPWTGQIANWLAEAYESCGMYEKALENAEIRVSSLKKNQAYNNEIKLSEVEEVIERIRGKMQNESRKLHN